MQRAMGGGREGGNELCVPTVWGQPLYIPHIFSNNPLKEKGDRPLSIQDKARIVDAFARSREELQLLFYVPRIQQLLEEILGLMATPFLLLWFFPRASIDICNFVRNTLFESENLGDWCCLSCFELDRTDPRLSRDGKLEKSALSFALTYRCAPTLEHGEQMWSDGTGTQSSSRGFVSDLGCTAHTRAPPIGGPARENN